MKEDGRPAEEEEQNLDRGRDEANGTYEQVIGSGDIYKSVRSRDNGTMHEIKYRKRGAVCPHSQMKDDYKMERKWLKL